MQISDSHREPSSRDCEILTDVIRTFIGTGDPVSSRTVAKLARHGLSAASIRNVMADLEDLGLLSQPHTSAGRVPTPAGYHYYIDSLMPARKVPARERRYIEENLQGSQDIESLMGVATHLLTELSHQIGLVMTPVLGESVLKSINFLNLSGGRILCVLESSSGLVEHQVVETRQLLTQEELLRISNYLTTDFRGLSLRAIRDRLVVLMAVDRARIDNMLSQAIELAQQALGADVTPDLLVEGASFVLEKPELSDLSRVRRLLETFSDKAELVVLLNQLIERSGVHALIGEDSDLTSDLDFSLVATPYGMGDQRLGTLGIFGPSRMEYQRIVPLVKFLGETLSRALEAASGSFEDEE